MAICGKSDNFWMREMFDTVSRRYILLNRIITFGQDDKWRDAVVERVQLKERDRVLDMCTGTADIALRIARKFPFNDVYALDFSSDMLDEAKIRQKAAGLRNVIFKQADCAATGFDTEEFDYVTISFGFRNLSYSRENLDKALKEIYRILKKGGRLIILETSQPHNVIVKALFHFYASKLVPFAGRLFSGNGLPYGYLGDSITRFFDKTSLISQLNSYGFNGEAVKSFMLGGVLLCASQKQS